MQLLLLPLLGPLHMRYPALNAMTMRDVLAGFGPEVAATTVLTGEALAGTAWQDTTELALPLGIVPWLRKQGVPLLAVGIDSPDPSAEADFRRYVREMPGLQEKLAGHMSLEARLAQLLGGSLNLRSLQEEVLPLVRELEYELRGAAGDGPATDWRWERAKTAVKELLKGAVPERIALLAGVLELPALEAALEEHGVTPVTLPLNVEVSEEARTRNLLDHALRLDRQGDTDALHDALEQEGSAEAGYARANMLLAAGLQQEALDLLERVSHGDFSQPYYLPGWLLARLGQLRDLCGQRGTALQAYRGVLALDWASQEALAAARAGLEQPFTLLPAGQVD